VSKQVTEELTLAMLRLSEVNSDVWRQFTEAMQARARALSDALVDAPADKMQVMQGQAQCMVQLCKQLASCREDGRNIIALRQKQSAKANI
jgi:hypothetical protein